MERAAEHARAAAAHRARGRPPRRLPPARPVRQGVPPPPRRRAVGLPLARGRSTASATARASPPEPVRVAARRASRDLRVALCRGRPIGCREHGRRTSTRARRERRRTVRQMVVVGVVASALGIALGLSIHWFPPAASKQADQIDTLWDVLLIASVPVFVLVDVGRAASSVLEFRMRPGEEHLDGPPIHGNTRSRSSGRRSRRSCSSACAPTPTSSCTTSRRRRPRQRAMRVARHRPAVRLDLRLQRGRQASSRTRAALPAGRRVGEVRRPVQGRPARLLGPGLPDEDRRGARDHHALPRHARTRHRHLPDRLRRALRPRPRVHAPAPRTSLARPAVRHVGARR